MCPSSDLGQRCFLCFFVVFFFDIYLFLIDRDRVRAGEGQREGETQNPKQAPGSEPSAQSPTWGSNSQTVRSGPELKSDAQQTEPPRCPWGNVLFQERVFDKLRDNFRSAASQDKGLFVLCPPGTNRTQISDVGRL